MSFEALVALYDAIAEAPHVEALVPAFNAAMAPLFPGSHLLLKQDLPDLKDEWWTQITAMVTDFFGGKGIIPAAMLFEGYASKLPPSDYCVPLSLNGELFGFLGIVNNEEAPDSQANLPMLERIAHMLVMRLDHLKLQQSGNELLPFLMASQQKAVMGELLRQRNEDLEEASRQIELSYQELLMNKQQLVQAEKLSSLGRFTAGIAHELNTPLSAILNSTQTIGDLIKEYVDSVGDPEVGVEDHEAIAGDMKSALAIIKSAAEKSGKLIRTLKNNTRDAGERKRFSVQKEIEDTLLLLQPQLKEGGCLMHLELPSEEYFLTGDAAKLGQVVTNLVVNAVDAYEGQKGKTVGLVLGLKERDIELKVYDEGCGIPQEIINRIFDPMFTTKDIGKGTGLGLMIVQGIVTGHFGGTISVESVVGSGTTFTVRLPLAGPAETSENMEAAAVQ